MKTAIFDLDGTLADTAHDLIGAANALLTARALPLLDCVAARATAGRGGRALIRLGFERAGAPLSETQVDGLFPAYLEAYAARLDHETKLYPGVIETLEALAADGWAMGVCTNKPERLAVDLLGRLGAARFFPAILGADTLPVRKPDPRHVSETVARIGGDLARAVMIGDSVTDRDAARNADVPIVLTTFGYSITPIEELAPDRIVASFAELTEVLPQMV